MGDIILISSLSTFKCCIIPFHLLFCLHVRDTAKVYAWLLCLAGAKRWSDVLSSVSGSVILQLLYICLWMILS